MDVRVLDKAMEGLKFDAGRHELMVDGPWITSAREQSKHPDLFIYRHKVTKKFVLAEWIEQKKNCIELCTMSGPPDHFPSDLPDMKWVCWRVRQTARSNAKQIHENAWETKREDQRKLDASADEKKLAIRHLRRRGAHDMADQLEQCLIPYVGKEEGGEEYEELIEDLNFNAKDRVISVPPSYPPDLTVPRIPHHAQ